MSNKDLLDSTGDWSQQRVVTSNGEESGEEDTCAHN